MSVFPLSQAERTAPSLVEPDPVFYNRSREFLALRLFYRDHRAGSEDFWPATTAAANKWASDIEAILKAADDEEYIEEAEEWMAPYFSRISESPYGDPEPIPPDLESLIDAACLKSLTMQPANLRHLLLCPDPRAEEFSDAVRITLYLTGKEGYSVFIKMLSETSMNASDLALADLCSKLIGDFLVIHGNKAYFYSQLRHLWSQVDLKILMSSVFSDILVPFLKENIEKQNVKLRNKEVKVARSMDKVETQRLEERVKCQEKFCKALEKLQSKVEKCSAQDAVTTLIRRDRLINREVEFDPVNSWIPMGRYLVPLDRREKTRLRLKTDYATRVWSCMPGGPPNTAFWARTIGQILSRKVAGEDVDSTQEEFDQFFELLAQYVSGDTSDKTLLLLIGPGNNGKSWLTQYLLWLLGEDAEALPPSTLQMGKDSAARSGPLVEVMATVGKRLLIQTEPCPNAKFSSQRITQITGGDAQSARNLYDSKMTKFVSRAHIIVAANVIPPLDRVGDAIDARIKVGDLNARFVADPADPETIARYPEQRLFAMNRKLLDEAKRPENAAGFVELLRLGYQRLLELQELKELKQADHPGLLSHPRFLEDRRRYLFSASAAGSYFSERLMTEGLSRNDWLVPINVYNDYRIWAQRNGFTTPMTAMAFYKSLPGDIKKVRKERGIFWGAKFAPEPDPLQAWVTGDPGTGEKSTEL